MPGGKRGLDTAVPSGAGQTFQTSERHDRRERSSPSAVLIIVHDPEMRKLLGAGLERHGFPLLQAASAMEGIETMRSRRPGAILVDMDIQDADPLDVIQRLREWSSTPILALAGRFNNAGAVEALDLGANDYINNDCPIDELSARLRAAHRSAPPAAPQFFQSGNLSVDLVTRTVKVAERRVYLTATEYSLLHLFVRHAGNVVTYAQILREVWGLDELSKGVYVRVYLRALRKKLEDPAEPTLFVSEPAVGYRLVMREP